MSTSAMKRNRKTAKRYLGITLFCCLFSAVYEAFSHHVFSGWMIALPLYPAIMGVLPFLLLRRRIPGWSRQLWHCGVATVMAGSCLTGVFEIAGVHMPYTAAFLAMGSMLMMTAVVLLGVGTRQRTT